MSKLRCGWLWLTHRPSDVHVLLVCVCVTPADLGLTTDQLSCHPHPRVIHIKQGYSLALVGRDTSCFHIVHIPFCHKHKRRRDRKAPMSRPLSFQALMTFFVLASCKWSWVSHGVYTFFQQPLCWLLSCKEQPKSTTEFNKWVKSWWPSYLQFCVQVFLSVDSAL